MLQFCLVTRGAVEFHVSETVLSLSPGQGIFINAGQLHMARDGDGQGAYLCLDFHPRLIAGTAGGAVEREMAQFIHDHFDQELTLDQIAASAALSPGPAAACSNGTWAAPPLPMCRTCAFSGPPGCWRPPTSPSPRSPPGAATAAPAISPSPFGRRRACPPPPIGSGCLEKTREIDKISTKCYFKCSMYPDVEVFP